MKRHSKRNIISRTSSAIGILNIDQVKLFWALVIGIGLAIFAYIYFVNVTILNTANRQKTEEKIVQIKSEIASLEFELLDKNRELTREFALGLGFKEVEAKTFVDKTANQTLSLNEIR